MKFRIEPINGGYYLYVLDGEGEECGWEYIGFSFTAIGAKYQARKYKKRQEKGGEFKLSDGILERFRKYLKQERRRKGEENDGTIDEAKPMP